MSGHESKKHPGASVTLATSVVENLNILNVVTADRVVAQISTTHFPDQYVPEVTFLGTHFENLRIARHKVIPILNLKLAGQKPENDQHYVADNTSLMSVVKEQYKNLAGWLKGRNGMRAAGPDGSLTLQYYGGKPDYNKIQSDVASAREADGTSDGITCSLVEDVVIEPIKDGSETSERDANELVDGKCGHVIHIPDFGTIFLAELKVNHNSFDLTMIRVELGCIADGDASMVHCNANGKGHPIAPPPPTP